MRADALRRHQRILAEARRLFAEHGSEVPLESVAEASGVGIATLYRNFASRDELLVAVTLDIVGDIDAALRAAHDGLAQSPSLAWEQLIRGLVTLDLGALTDALGGPRWQHVPSEVAAAQDAALASLDGLLTELVDHGAVRSDLAALEVIVAIGVLTRPQPEALRRATPHLVDHLVDAFLAWSRPAVS